MPHRKQIIEKCILLSMEAQKNYFNDVFWSPVEINNQFNYEKINVCIGIKKEILEDAELFSDIEEQIYENLIFFEKITEFKFSISFREDTRMCNINHCKNNNECLKNLIYKGEN